jgi:hypothetical protein
MYLVPLENCAQCRATQHVFYKLFTFKTIPNLQLKCTLYVVHFLPVLDPLPSLQEEEEFLTLLRYLPGKLFYEGVVIEVLF